MAKPVDLAEMAETAALLQIVVMTPVMTAQKERTHQVQAVAVAPVVARVAVFTLKPAECLQ
jgi:hypothetical protein